MPKVKTDKFGDNMFTELYAKYAVLPIEEFRQYCVSLIETHTVSKRKDKDVFIRSLQADRSKDKMVKRVSDIMLAGEGMAVGSSLKSYY